MNRVNLAVAALATAALGVAVIVDLNAMKPDKIVDAGSGKTARADDVPKATQVVVTTMVPAPVLALSKLGVDEDGAQFAYLPDFDGGVVVLSAMPCVRRKATSVLASDCMRQVPGDIPRDFGVLNRFPAVNSVGTDCEPVPCSVWVGDPTP